MVEILKRDGSLEKINERKIIVAITKAMQDTGDRGYTLTENDAKVINTIANEVVEIILLSGFDKYSVEEIQDLVEMKLMEKNLYSVAKRYMLYRAKRNELRNKKWDMTELERGILENRYLHNGEDFEGWLDRISAGNNRIKKRIRNKQFLFGGRILANRGTITPNNKSTYSNCYVVPQPEDSIEGIFKTAAEMARTYSYGGGVGISLEKLRPRGAKVNNSAKETSGAVSFMELFDLTTKIIGQAGRRKI